MKYSVALIMAVAAIGSSAQSLSDLPECGQGCIQRLIGAAEGLGCKADDIACLCKNPDFTYGIRDCSNEACSDAADAIINYGAEYCKSNGGVVITTAGTAVTTAAATGTDASGGAGGAAGGLHTKSSDGDVAVATSTVETVVEESGSSVSKTNTETYYSSPTGSSTSDGSSQSGDSTKGGAAGGSDSTKTNKDGATTTQKSDSTSTDGSGSGNSDNDGGDGNAAVNAAAPVGLLAAAGIMAILI